MWTNENRAKYNHHLRYPSDPPPSRGQALTDDEWALVEPSFRR